MESVSSVKTREKCVTPKTPGGISKSLLTPCRRVGLSRNWKNKGPSPFISPLSSQIPTKTEEKEVKPSKKRKVCQQIETELKINVKDVPNNVSENIEITCTSPLKADVNDLDSTPRNTDLPRKRSKILDVSNNNENVDENIAKLDVCKSNKEVNSELKTSKITKLTRTKSSKKIKTITSPVKCVESNINSTPKQDATCTKIDERNYTITEETANETKKESPNNLTKECIVVIQKKLFRSEENESKNLKLTVSSAELGKNSQVMFDSDSDEVPLSKINKNEIKLSREEINKVILGEEDDFALKTNVKIDKKISNGDLKANKAMEKVTKEIKKVKSSKKERKILNSIDDDDDDFELDKRTILIRKSYDKMPKLQKAKSTGSITQKDIELLKDRIEEKKRMLLAKTLTKDTEELRILIKKWQKGCQDALMELMDLMKLKFPEKQNMEYSEILKMLKIPPNLVCYDSDNDCFDTPDDTSIILSKFNK